MSHSPGQHWPTGNAIHLSISTLYRSFDPTPGASEEGAQKHHIFKLRYEGIDFLAKWRVLQRSLRVGIPLFKRIYKASAWERNPIAGMEVR